MPEQTFTFILFTVTVATWCSWFIGSNEPWQTQGSILNIKRLLYSTNLQNTSHNIQNNIKMHEKQEFLEAWTILNIKAQAHSITEVINLTSWKMESDWLIDWLIDWHWVQALTVLIHLGLTDRPFGPHNLISVQESLVPLPKFQMAPRLKILMSSGSNKGTQMYYPFLSKSPGKRIFSRFPNGAPMERDAHLQGIFTSLNPLNAELNPICWHY